MVLLCNLCIAFSKVGPQLLSVGALSNRSEEAVLSCMAVEMFDDKTVYECQAVLCPEEDGGFSAHVANLPGVVSQGETQDDALTNLREAFVGAIETYREMGMEIPWSDKDLSFCGENCQRRWILVDA